MILISHSEECSSQSLGTMEQALWRDLQPSATTLGNRSHSRDAVRTSCRNNIKGIHKGMCGQCL